MRLRRDLFDELLLKGHRANFASKIGLLRSMCDKHPWLGQIASPEFLRRLDELRDLRNRFAHYPVSFFPEQTDGGQSLLAKLVCRDKDLVLDDAFLKDFDRRFGTLDLELQQAHDAVSKRATQSIGPEIAPDARPYSDL